MSLPSRLAVPAVLFSFLVVGVPSAASGAAYVFVRSGDSWTQQAKVTPPMSPVSGYFGKSVAVSGDTIVVGAPEAQTPAGYTGTAFVYVRSGTTWTEQSELIPHHLGAAPQFGLAVAVDGDTALVGALRDEGPGGQNSGSARVFIRSGTEWTEQAQLVASDGSQGDLFGESVELDGDTAVVGAPSANTAAGELVGKAYVFVPSGGVWTEQAALSAPDGVSGDQFGWSVGVDGNRVIVG